MGTGDRKNVDKYEASMRAADKLLKSLGAALQTIDTWTTEAPDDEHYVTALKIRVRYDDVGDVLVVVSADSVEGPQVAFHSADTVSEVIKGLANRLTNGSLKWREDKPYVPESS